MIALVVFIFVGILALAIYLGTDSTFAKLQRLVCSDYDAEGIFIEYLSDHSDEWDFSYDGDKNRIRILIAKYEPELMEMKYFEREEYKKRIKKAQLIPFYFKYIGKGDYYDAERRMYYFVKAKYFEVIKSYDVS